MKKSAKKEIQVVKFYYYRSKNTYQYLQEKKEIHQLKS